METINYCTQCGASVSMQYPAGDNHQRAVCTSCGHIHYSNPKIVAGCLLGVEDKILLCLRDIEPRRGFWTVPAGYMENGESTEAGARREASEEACAQADELRLFAVYDLPEIDHVYLLYTGQLVDGHAEAGHETQAVGLFSESEIPWDDIAFSLVTESLQRYFDDRRTGVQQLHRAVFTGLPGTHIEIQRCLPA